MRRALIVHGGLSGHEAKDAATLSLPPVQDFATRGLLLAAGAL